MGGLTLVEAVVVTGLVALQLALLTPALGRIRTEVRATCCGNNLRQWGLATTLYVADHEDLLPPEGVPNPGDRDTRNGWYIQLPREIGLPPYHHMPWRTNADMPRDQSPWLCPANPRRSNGRNLFHYCLNREVDGSGETDTRVRWSSLPDPPRWVWLFDSKNLPAVGTWRFVAEGLHGRGAQFLFLDGHVRRLRAAEWQIASNQPQGGTTTQVRWRP